MSQLTEAPVSPHIPLPEPPEDGIVHGGSRLLFRQAARQLGVELSSEEDYDWVVVLGAAMLIDHLVDDEGADVVAPFSHLMAGNVRPDLDADVQARAINYFHRQSSERRTDILDDVARVSELAAAQRAAVRAAEVIDIRVTEADILAGLLKLKITTAPDTAARVRFNRWLQSWSRCGYLLDSLMDIRPDYENGESGVLPTASARLQYAQAASSESITAVRQTPPALLRSCAVNGIRYVVRQKRVAISSLDTP